MLIIGLTGMVASGKNFVADFFKKKGAAIFDADLEVHKIFSTNQASNWQIISKIAKEFPPAIDKDGFVNRKILGQIVFHDPKKLKILEEIIHPEIRKKEIQFLKLMRRRGKKFVVLNIPLLLDKPGYQRCDKIISVIISDIAQKYRFTKRCQKNNQNQTQAELSLKQIKTRQINNLKHKQKADFLIHNGISKAYTIRQINNIYHKIF
jgi:dephospho-CoA kinase